MVQSLKMPTFKMHARFIGFLSTCSMLSVIVASCSHSKEKIVFVTERVQCSYHNGDRRCDRGAPWGYYDTSGKKFSTDLDAVLSSCKSISMLEQDFVQKVNSGDYRIKSTTDWNRVIRFKNDGKEWGTWKPTTYENRANCIGKQYVVTY